MENVSGEIVANPDGYSPFMLVLRVADEVIGELPVEDMEEGRTILEEALRLLAPA